MMQFIRSNVGKVFVYAIIPAFIAWMVLDLGMDVLGGGATRANELGSVNGQAITVEAYNQQYNALYQQAQQRGAVTSEAARALQEEAWERLVTEMLVQQELRRRGITVSDREIVWAARNLPHPDLMREEIFLTNGNFDIEKYRQFLAGPTVDGQMFAQLEGYYREWLPREKLLRQLGAGRYVTDAELWRAYRDQNETAVVDFVALDLSKLPQPAVSDAEVRRYYEQNREQFRRMEGARLKVAAIPLTIGDEDRAATVERARALREEIRGGADFAAVARRESGDPGSREQGGALGTFGRGQMVPEFDAVVFSLPVGEISEPVTTAYGVHLVQVLAREGDEATARHILLEFTKGEADLERMEKQLEEVRTAGRTRGLQAAASGQPGVVYREGIEISASAPFIPGVGPAMDAINWARDEAEAREEGAGDRVSDLLESRDAIYLVELEEYVPAGITPVAQATPSIRLILEQRKRREAGRVEAEKMVAEIGQGRTLEQVAESRGLQVERSQPFSRVDPNPRFGQANAAAGASFGTPLGQVGPPAVTTAGVFLVRPVERAEADRREWERQKVQQRAQAMTAVQQDLFAQWLASVREEARIRDNRDRMLGRSS
jgi:peptidyl-prolyl cis-trans isomerase D